ncbi:WRB/Get1 family [Gorgonomyces haynaldii]|nr:WRB/Get1 family [Gorgonomyces haynaldii]
MLSLLVILGLTVLYQVCYSLGFDRIGSLIFQWTHDSTQVKTLKQEIVQLRQELSGISAQDHFAKWARLRRKLDKLSSEYDVVKRDYVLKRQTWTSGVSYGLWATLWILQLVFVLYWMNTPIFYLPHDWFGPLTSWLKISVWILLVFSLQSGSG